MKCTLVGLCLSGWLAFQATPQDTSLIGPFINLGAVGVCLVVLALWYRRKDQRYEERMDERIKQEQEFRKEISDIHANYRKEILELNEKYRLALEKFNQTLESLIRMWQARRGKGGGDV